MVLSNYELLSVESRPTAETWDAFVRDVLIRPWLSEYRTQTPWDSGVMEISQAELTYLLDAARTFTGATRGDDRVVAVWGRSRSDSGSKRDRARQAGLIPGPATWSELAGTEGKAGRDRGHFVARAAGGGMDLNLFPQAVGLKPRDLEAGRVVAGDGAVCHGPSGDSTLPPTLVRWADLDPGGAIDYALNGRRPVVVEAV